MSQVKFYKTKNIIVNPDMSVGADVLPTDIYHYESETCSLLTPDSLIFDTYSKDIIYAETATKCYSLTNKQKSYFVILTTNSIKWTGQLPVESQYFTVFYYDAADYCLTKQTKYFSNEYDGQLTITWGSNYLKIDPTTGAIYQPVTNTDGMNSCLICLPIY